jgi:hypothetical protein
LVLSALFDGGKDVAVIAWYDDAERNLPVDRSVIGIQSPIARREPDLGTRSSSQCPRQLAQRRRRFGTIHR